MTPAHDPWRVAADMLSASRDDGTGWSPQDYQRMPEGDDWHTWLFLAGRYTGKTDTMAHHVVRHVQGPPCDPSVPGGHRIGIVGPTLGDAVHSCVSGKTGLIAHDPAAKLVGGMGGAEVRFANGTIGMLFGASSPEDLTRLRSRTNRCLDWFEEWAQWRYLTEATDQARLGRRLGSWPKCLISTTPKPRELIKAWISGAPGVVVTRASILDNAYAEPRVVEEFLQRYADTRLGRQELYGEIIDDIEGALWRIEQILTVHEVPPIRRKVVFLDPSTGAGGPGSDEAGIVVAAKGMDGRGYVLDDRSLRAEPSGWAGVYAAAHDEHECDALLCEDAFGQMELVRLALKSIGRQDLALRVRGIKIRAGKRLRAEPVVSLYEQGKVSHLHGAVPGLEAQMLSWVPDEPEFSPDRVDALVGALTDLLLTGTMRAVQFGDVAGQTWRR